MHELGVVFYVIKDVKKVCLDNNIKKINSVTLEIGEVSGVIHKELIECFNWAKKREVETQDAELIIETINAVTFCEDCEQNFATVEHGKICPYCGSENTYLLVGNEFNIKEIEVYDNDEDT